jgi:hypothetical protein
MKNKSLISLLATAMMIFVAGCTLPTGGGPGPRVWIDTPLNGDTLAFGPVVVKSHASFEDGTASAALLVNGVQVRMDVPTEPSAPLTTFAQVWEPTSPGDYGLEVVVTDSSGNTGRSLVRVHISTEVYLPPLCSLDELVAPESLEPADGASVASPVHFVWSYPESACHPHSFAISISEPGGSADITGIGWGSITYDWLTTSRDWRLPDGSCYYWRTLAYSGSGYGPPSAVRRFCIPSMAAAVPGVSTVTASVPLPAITIMPSVIPPNLIPTFIFTSNANCRQGPDTAYEVVTSFFANDQVTIEGKNDNSSWYWALIPNSNSHCWISGKTGSPQGPMSGLMVIPAPALPATTEAPPPVVVATTPAPVSVAPAAPGKFSISTKSCTSSEYVVTLHWSNVAGESGYRIYRDGTLIATLPENSTAYDDASPDYNSHSYQVQSYNDAGSANGSAKNSEGCLY